MSESFLLSSSIHGLAYIAKTKSFVKLFWVAVVTFCFSSAGYLIIQAFRGWSESPIRTTIETLPIEKLTFPKVTVCPPRKTFTNLNYDLMEAETKTLSQEARYDLMNLTLELLYETYFNELMQNKSAIVTKDAARHWYYGVDKLVPPFYSESVEFNQFVTFVNTIASKGSITTNNFGEPFNITAFFTRVFGDFNIMVPREARNSSLVLKIKKDSFHSTGKDLLYIVDHESFEGDADFSVTFSPADHVKRSNIYVIRMDRKISPRDLLNLDQRIMPGFSIYWRYDPPVNLSLPQMIFARETVAQQFARLVSTLFT